MNTNTNTAQTILTQLGGNRFLVMTGAKNLVADATGLAFSLSSTTTRNKANKVVIDLIGDDTYTVRFYSLRALKMRPISTHAGIYADGLAKLVATETGLILSL